MFVENLALLIMKNHLPLQFVESVWLKRLVLQLCPHVQFPFQKLFSNIVLFKLVEKTKEMYVLPLLNDCSCVITSFLFMDVQGCTCCVCFSHNFFRI